MKQFIEKFGNYVLEGDTIHTEIDGITFLATIVRDDSIDSPEEKDEGFWPSLNPNDAGYIGDNPGLSNGTMLRKFDKQKAKAQAVMDSFKNNEWFYCGIVIKATKTVNIKGRVSEEIEISSHAASLWGIECNYPGSDNSYLNEVANELLEEAIMYCKEVVKQLKDS